MRPSRTVPIGEDDRNNVTVEPLLSGVLIDISPMDCAPKTRYGGRPRPTEPPEVYDRRIHDPPRCFDFSLRNPSETFACVFGSLALRTISVSSLFAFGDFAAFSILLMSCPIAPLPFS